MDAKKYMIILKGVIKTRDIVTCKYNPETQKYSIVFQGNNRIFQYAYGNVEFLKEPEVLSPDTYRVSRAGKDFHDVEAIYVFNGIRESYWHICFRDGSEKDYKQDELQISRSCLADPKINHVFEYLKQISKLSDLRNEVTGEKILEKRYIELNYVGTDTALASYLDPAKKVELSKRTFIPIFPFGCNKSQYKAVKNAMESQLSVIQGPPGTGKTQTILNIIANILIQGKTVQVVSNNNAAIENVYEKLSSPKYNLGFVVAALGNADNRKAFIENQKDDYPQFSDWHIQGQGTDLIGQVRDKSERLRSVFEKQERLACLKQEFSQLELEEKYFQEYLKETDANVDVVASRKKISSERSMEFWQECQAWSEKDKKPGLFFVLRSVLHFGIMDWTFYKQDISKIITTFQGLFLKYKKAEIVEEMNGITEFLETVDVGLLNDMCSDSMIVLKDALARKYQKRKQRHRFTETDLWVRYKEVLAEYPVVLSTTFSSRTSLNSDAIYDYVIMDEASQVDIATGALALSGAKCAVIVGDTRQLPNVVTEETRKRADAIFGDFNIQEGYRFTKSFLQSVLDVMPDVVQTLLREHYRCHPKIINFCNQKFYRGELIIMTEDCGEDNVLTAVKTVEGNHERNHYSQRQIDVIKQEILSNLQVEKNEIGIIAPYKNQVNAMAAQLEGIDIATVHKFQGREKEVIIISTVDDEISDFADDPYLLNVAVSRAKKKLVLVVSGTDQLPDRNISDLIAYIRYNNFDVQDSKIYSIFDYLYKQYTSARQIYLSKHKKISEQDSENLMYGLIVDILQTNECGSLNVICHYPLNMLIKNPDLLSDRECQYAMNPATHLDFLIFNRISKQPVLAVEVDGYDYHKEGTAQFERDRLKDHILDLYSIPFLRFQTNGSEEREVIERKLAGLLKGTSES